MTGPDEIKQDATTASDEAAAPGEAANAVAPSPAADTDPTVASASVEQPVQDTAADAASPHDDDDPSLDPDYHDPAPAVEPDNQPELETAQGGDSGGDGGNDGGGASDGGDGGDGGGGTDAPGDKPAADSPGEQETEAPHEMSLVDHLDELRKRLTKCVFFAIGGFLACYGFAEQIFNVLMQPLVQHLPKDSHLIFTALPEAFFTYIKVSIVAGIFVSSPFSFYQIWKFIAPGLYKEERSMLFPLAFLSAIFFVGGAAFCYTQVFPIAFEFFASFSNETMVLTPKVSEFLDFSLKMLFAFGIVFEMPLFSFFLARMGVVTAALLGKFRKYAVIGAFVVAAILTPPDVASQLLMAGPLLILYEISIIVAKIFGRKPDKTDDDNDETAATA